jgi:hypothetical protein
MLLLRACHRPLRLPTALEGRGRMGDAPEAGTCWVQPPKEFSSVRDFCSVLARWGGDCCAKCVLTPLPCRCHQVWLLSRTGWTRVTPLTTHTYYLTRRCY